MKNDVKRVFVFLEQFLLKSSRSAIYLYGHNRLDENYLAKEGTGGICQQHETSQVR